MDQKRRIFMTNKRTLKKRINVICETLYAECVAVSLYGTEESKNNVEDLIHAIMKMQNHYLSRVSYPEPGIKPKTYYKDLREKFGKQVTEILDQINS